MKKSRLTFALIFFVSLLGAISCVDGTDIAPQDINMDIELEDQLSNPGDTGVIIGSGT